MRRRRTRDEKPAVDVFRLQPQSPLPETPLFIQANLIKVAAVKRKRKADRLLQGVEVWRY